MGLTAFVFEVILISLSGVMAPGPMTAVTIGKSSEKINAGALVAVGHGIVEIPLVILLFFGLNIFVNNIYIKTFILFAGSIFLFLLSFDMLKNMKKDYSAEYKKNSLIVSGILLSILNPYFLLWWISVGSILLIKSKTFGTKGFVIFLFIHILCDIVWLFFLSILSNKGNKIFGEVFKKIIFLASGLLLFFIGIKYFIDLIKILFENKFFIN